MYLGIDIGGTKCAVLKGTANMQVLKREQFATMSVEKTLERIMELAEQMWPFEAIGISCGGPLDSKKGVILSPPNLPGWDAIPITAMLTGRFGVPCYLMNDANACGLAEWQHGAGKGSENMLFFTFGTGLGAAIILGGRLITGASDMAGEAGHIRLAPFGPVGYGKAGSFEGFCSGSGIAQLGQTMAKEQLQQGLTVRYCDSMEALPSVTAKSIALAADAGDPTAIEVYRQSGEMLGRGLSVIIDILNPDTIVLGSIFERSENLLRPSMEAVISKEALPRAAKACRIVPAALGNSVGDIAALTVAAYGQGGN